MLTPPKLWEKAQCFHSIITMLSTTTVKKHEVIIFINGNTVCVIFWSILYYCKPMLIGNNNTVKQPADY